ncbi:MAG: hypothetical protein IKF91_00725 [Bacilli bacterium]|nr:hypothetical protein [Bacilli bacterium]
MIKITNELSNEEYGSIFFEIDDIERWDNLVRFTQILIDDFKLNNLMKIEECQVKCESGFDMNPSMVFFNDENDLDNSDEIFSINDFEKVFKENEKIKSEFNEENNPEIELVLLNEEKNIRTDLDIYNDENSKKVRGRFMYDLDQANMVKQIILNALESADKKYNTGK